MSTLNVTVLGAAPAASTAAPAIVFRLRIEDLDNRRIHAMALRCLARIEARRRPYAADEQARLYELFGDPSQWHHTLQSVTWAQTSLLVPSFERRTEIDLTIPCTYDLEVAGSKYLHGIRGGDIPLLFLFSGTVFAGSGTLSVEPVSWDLEAPYRMPADLWRQTMDRFFPGGWIRLRTETLDRLQAYRGRSADVTWDAAIARLLAEAAATEPA